MPTVYISIHLGSCVILLGAEDVQYKRCVCIVIVKKPMAARLLICILPVHRDIMWHLGVRRLIVVSGGMSH